MKRRTFLTTAASLAAAPSLLHSAAADTTKRKTILLRSAWDTVNIGDIGHTPGTLHVFEKFLPEVDVVLWPAKINEPVETLLMRRFPKLKIVRGDLQKVGDGGEVGRAIAACDLVVHNSSMSESTILAKHCEAIGKPFGWFGNSMFPKFAANPANIEIVNRAAFVYCRETLTLESLRKAGAKPPVLEFGPDGCFGIDVRNDAAADSFLRERGLEDRRFITVQLRTNTQKHPGTDSFLNPANPTPEQQADDERRAEKFRAIVTTWVRRTGWKVLIAPEVEKEIRHNKRLILDRLPADVAQNVVLRDQFWNADEAASVFARAHTVVCHEPHSCIIALAVGTPILHTYSAFHSPKWHMFADIGLNDWLPSLDELPNEAIIDRLMTIRDDYPAALAKVKQAMTFVYERFAESTAVMRKVMA